MIFDFSPWIDLPLVWGILLAFAVFLYVLLDGFDLGIGILFPFAPTDKCRNCMMNSIAPFWDGNETWLVFGGISLFGAFPLAYSILLPAMYFPVILMLLGLIFRGVAFEFRYKSAPRQRVLWDTFFHLGSLLAAFMQGMILGTFVQGITVVDRSFAGTPLDWISPLSLLTGLGLLFGYVLLGSTWMIFKTEGPPQKWARHVASYVWGFVLLFMGLICLVMPMMEERIYTLWFSIPNIYYLCPLPLLTALLFFFLWRTLSQTSDWLPFVLSLSLFLLGYIGLGISLWPWIVPYTLTLWETSAAPESQTLLLSGTFFFLPLVLIYTAYSYYLFRGKTHHAQMH